MLEGFLCRAIRISHTQLGLDMTQFVIGENVSFDSVWVIRCRQSKTCFKRHVKSSLFGVAFDQLGSNGEAFQFQNK